MTYERPLPGTPQAQRFFSLDDLGSLPKPEWAIEGMFELNSLVMLAAPSYSFKSFMAIDWMMCIAAGRKWNHRRTITAKVLYVLGEGKANLKKRCDAWAFNAKLLPEERQRLNENFRVSFEVPQLASKASVDNMLAQLDAENFKPTVLVIDTFARSFVGLDENSPRDTGLWIEQADRLRQLGYTVIFIHHTRKNTEFGVVFRGSTAIIGAMDTAMLMSRDFRTNEVKLEITKQKDNDEGDPLFFERRLVNPTGIKQDGSMVLTSVIKADSRFTAEGIALDASTKDVIEDDDFASDRARARQLAALHGISIAAAQSRILRFRKSEDNKRHSKDGSQVINDGGDHIDPLTGEVLPASTELELQP